MANLERDTLLGYGLPILRVLADGEPWPLEALRRELRDRGVRGITLGRTLGELEGAAMIEQGGDGWRLAPIGRALLERRRDA